MLWSWLILRQGQSTLLLWYWLSLGFPLDAQCWWWRCCQSRTTLGPTTHGNPLTMAFHNETFFKAYDESEIAGMWCWLSAEAVVRVGLEGFHCPPSWSIGCLQSRRCNAPAWVSSSMSSIPVNTCLACLISLLWDWARSELGILLSQRRSSYAVLRQSCPVFRFSRHLIDASGANHGP